MQDLFWKNRNDEQIVISSLFAIGSIRVGHRNPAPTIDQKAARDSRPRRSRQPQNADDRAGPLCRFGGPRHCC